MCINGPTSQHGNRESARLRLGPVSHSQGSSNSGIDLRMSSNTEPRMTNKNQSFQGAKHQNSGHNFIQPLSLSDRFSSLEVSPYLQTSINFQQPPGVPQPLMSLNLNPEVKINTGTKSSEVDIGTKSSVRTRRVRAVNRGREAITAKPFVTSDRWDDDDNGGIFTTSYNQSRSQIATSEERCVNQTVQIKTEPQLSSDEKIPANICLLSLAQQPSISEFQKSSFELTHFESPDSFYLQRVDGVNDSLMEVEQSCRKIMDLMGSSLEKYWITEDNASRVLNEEFVVLRNTLNGSWARAQIRQGRQFLVDYGHFNDRFEKCFRMPQKLTNIPAQAYHCRLDVFPLKNIWSCKSFSNSHM